MGTYYNPTPLLDGLIVYLDAANIKSYPGSGTAWNNLISSSYNASLTNSPTYSSSGYFTFDGVSQGATLANTNYPAAWTDSISVEVWFRVPAAATWTNGNLGTIVQRGSFTGTVGLARTGTNNQIGSYIRGDASPANPAIALATVSRDVWYNATFNWDGSTTSIFVNGSLIQTSAVLTQTGVPENNTWLIATASAFGGSTGNFFQGDISVVKIYNISLNEQQVAENFNALRGRYGI